MRALLDTHAFLWWVTDDPQLSSTSRTIIADSGNINVTHNLGSKVELFFILSRLLGIVFEETVTTTTIFVTNIIIFVTILQI